MIADRFLVEGFDARERCIFSDECDPPDLPGTVIDARLAAGDDGRISVWPIPLQEQARGDDEQETIR